MEQGIHICVQKTLAETVMPWMAQMKVKCLSSTCFCAGKKLHGLHEGHLLSELPMAQVRAGCAGPGGLRAVVLWGRVAVLGLGCGCGALSGAEEGGLLADVGILPVLQGPSGSSGAQGRCGWQDPARGWRPEWERHQCLLSHGGELGPCGGGFTPRVDARAGCGDVVRQDKNSVFTQDLPQILLLP